MIYDNDILWEVFPQLSAIESKSTFCNLMFAKRHFGVII